MKSEKQKMLEGELYDPLDAELTRDRLFARQRCKALNDSPPDAPNARLAVLAELFGVTTDAWIEPPFHCDYGRNMTVGRKVFFNFNCVVLDVMAVRIGDYTLFGPGVQIYTAMHPMNADERRRGLEFAKPVTIGRDCWFGGAAVVCPGVTIGDKCVIGAGAVVTKDIPSGSFAAGNPCRVIRPV